MCFFPQRPNGSNPYNITYKCGACPECLAERAKYWALRCSMESLYSSSIMVTLTYDQYIRNKKGDIIGETIDTRQLSKRDVQLFMKRVRKKYSDCDVKYLIAGEHGTRTNRSHYHAILFNVPLPDLVPYKKSKRGNQIYLSATLTKLWNHGICTVDCKNSSPQIVRYCTKYAAKDSRCKDAFMLTSRGIGERALREKFNGKSYIISGREYPIPKSVWQWYILKKYQKRYSAIRQPLSVKYVAPAKNTDHHEATFRLRLNSPYNPRDPRFKNVDKVFKAMPVMCQDSIQHFLWRRAKLARERFQRCRDKDKVFKAYRSYWDNKIKALERHRPSDVERVAALPNGKYWHYKQAALQVLRNNKELGNGTWNLPPRSKCIVRSERSRWQPRYERCFRPKVIHNQTPPVLDRLKRFFHSVEDSVKVSICRLPPLVIIRQMTPFTIIPEKILP